MKGKLWLVVIGVGLLGFVVWANFFTGNDRPTTTATPLPTVTVTSSAHPSASPTSSATSTSSSDSGSDELFNPDDPPEGAPSSAEIHKAMDSAETYWQTLNTYGYGDTKAGDAIRRALPLMAAEKASEWKQDLSEIDAAGDSSWKSLVRNHKVNLTVVQESRIQEWDSEKPEVLWVALRYRSGTVDAGDSTLSSAAKDQYVAVRMVREGESWLASEERPVD